MQYNRGQLNSYIVNIGKIPSVDTVSLAMINDNLNMAIGIIAAKRFWPQLRQLNTVITTATDGDISYSLQSNVYEVEQMRITSPQSYSKELLYVPVEILRRMLPNKLIPGRTVPSRWTYYEPTIDTNNVETKQVSFDYRPDQAYTITYSYQAFPPLMTNDNQYPFFDSQYHIYPAYYALWKYAERVKQPSLNPQYFQMLWDEGIATIEQDFQSQTKQIPPIPGPDLGTP